MAKKSVLESFIGDMPSLALDDVDPGAVAKVDRFIGKKVSIYSPSTPDSSSPVFSRPINNSPSPTAQLLLRSISPSIAIAEEELAAQARAAAASPLEFEPVKFSGVRGEDVDFDKAISPLPTLEISVPSFVVSSAESAGFSSKRLADAEPPEQQPEKRSKVYR